LSSGITLDPWESDFASETSFPTATCRSRGTNWTALAVAHKRQAFSHVACSFAPHGEALLAQSNDGEVRLALKLRDGGLVLHIHQRERALPLALLLSDDARKRLFQRGFKKECVG
jgi:hypothetical protein